MTHAQAKSRHAHLAEEIRRHDHAYYVAAKPAISDREYDLLFAELLALEKEFPDLITPDSPSQRVAGAPSESFKRITHELQMLSLEKIPASDSPTKDEEPDRERRNRSVHVYAFLWFAPRRPFSGLRRSCHRDTGGHGQFQLRGPLHGCEWLQRFTRVFGRSRLSGGHLVAPDAPLGNDRRRVQPDRFRERRDRTLYIHPFVRSTPGWAVPLDRRSNHGDADDSGHIEH